MSSSSFTSEFQKLPESVQELIKKVVLELIPSKVILFGSRARGVHRTNSDFDICFVKKKVLEEKWTELFADLSESPISLYKIDLVEFELLNKEYQSIIMKEVKVLYG